MRLESAREDAVDDPARDVASPLVARSRSVSELKAVFFVKDLTGDANREDSYEDVVAGGGRKVQVTFKDGEVITGFTTAYSKERLGWFLVPADEGSNNLRIFVVNAAVAEVQFLS